jgi:hypothetical protein
MNTDRIVPGTTSCPITSSGTVALALANFSRMRASNSLAIVEQLGEDRVNDLLEGPKLAFHGRLLALARRTLGNTLKEEYDFELENPLWSEMVTS